MAKNRKKITKKTTRSHSSIEKSFAAECEEQLLIMSKALRKVKQSRTITAIGQDLSPAFRKRRAAALDATISQAESRFQAVLQDAPDDFSWKNSWAYANSLPITSYDLEDSVLDLTLGAALWMLDRYKDEDCLPDVLEILPSADELNSELLDWLPDFWDPSYEYDLVAMVRQVLIQRNQDCQPLSKENSLCVRSFMDSHTLAGTQHQDVPSRRLFDQLLELLPETAVERAAQRVSELFWEWSERYLRSRLILYRQQEELEDRIDRISAQIDAAEADLSAKKKLLHAHQQRPVLMAGSSDPLGLLKGASTDSKAAEFHRLDNLYKEYDRRVKQSEQKEEELSHLNFHIKDYIAKGNDFLKSGGFQEEIQAIWQDFTIGDPFELCFGVLLLLDRGSDLPWLYFPGTALMECAGLSMPWAHWDFENDEDRYDDFFAFEEQNDLPAPPPLKDLDSYMTSYSSVLETDQEPSTRDGEESRHLRNLPQIVYRMTGILLPRRFDRFADADDELLQLGISDPKARELLSFAMTLLSEAKHRTELPLSVDPLEEEPIKEEEPDPGEDIEALRQRISQLKKENDHLKTVSYEAGRSLREARKQNEEQEKAHELERQELADLRELVFHLQEGEDSQSGEAEDKSISFPCETSHRIVSFGGHDSWAREIRKKLPDVRFIDRDQLPNSETIRRADLIFIQSNSLSHAYFYRIIDEARRYRVPVRYFSYASAVKCAEQLVHADRNWDA